MTGCSVAEEEEVEQEPSLTPWQNPGAPAATQPRLVGPTPIPASEQFPLTPKDIQQGADGKYFVPDRGDGCDFHEVVNLTLEGREWILLGNPNCEMYWRYDPDTAEVVANPIMTPDKFPTATPSAYERPTPTAVPPGHFSTKPTPGMWPDPKDASLSADGKYSIPDKGDGCTWQEIYRESIDGQLWVILESPQCRGQFSFAPATGDTILDLHPTPRPTSTPTNPPEPTAEPDDDGSGAGPPHVEPPPPATLVTASGEQTSGVYNYCWKGLCVDMLGVMVPKEALIARADETLTFKLAIEPTQLVLLAWTLDRGSIVKEYEEFFAWRAQGETNLRYELPAESSFQFTPDFAPGRYVIVLGVRTSDGDVGYGFLLELAP